MEWRWLGGLALSLLYTIRAQHFIFPCALYLLYLKLNLCVCVCVCVFDHFVGLMHKCLSNFSVISLDHSLSRLEFFFFDRTCRHFISGVTSIFCFFSSVFYLSSDIVILQHRLIRIMLLTIFIIVSVLHKEFLKAF